MTFKYGLPAALAAGLVFASAASADTSLAAKPAQIMPKAVDWILNDVARVGEGYVAAGDRGHILVSDDGRHWRQVPVPVQAMLNRLRFADDQRGWAVGHDGALLGTQDGGQSWDLLHRDAEWGKPMYDVLFLDANRGILVGANGTIKTTADGGQSWTLIEPDFTFHGLNTYSILRLADGTIVVGGEKGMMARSLDDGETWQQVKTPYAGSFFGMLPYGDSGVFVYGLRGNVYSAADIKSLEEQDSMEWDEFSLETITDPEILAEQGWRYYPNELKESLFGGDRLGRTDALLVGVNGAVVRTDGDRMKVLSTPLEHTLGDALVTEDALITVGFSGVKTIPFAP